MVIATEAYEIKKFKTGHPVGLFNFYQSKAQNGQNVMEKL